MEDKYKLISLNGQWLYFIEILLKPIFVNITGDILALGGSGGKQLPKPMLTDISATIFRC